MSPGSVWQGRRCGWLLITGVGLHSRIMLQILRCVVNVFSFMHTTCLYRTEDVNCLKKLVWLGGYGLGSYRPRSLVRSGSMSLVPLLLAILMHYWRSDTSFLISSNLSLDNLHNTLHVSRTFKAKKRQASKNSTFLHLYIDHKST